MRISMLVMLAGIIALAGCATGVKGPSDEDLVKAESKACMAAATAKDIDGLMTHFSEDFSCSVLGDKASLKSFLDSAKSSGYLDELEITDATSETKIEGAKASVGPVDINGSFGSATAWFTATKEAAGWKITDMEITGI